jgi:PAS domain S-box-containing protein
MIPAEQKADRVRGHRFRRKTGPSAPEGAAHEVSAPREALITMDGEGLITEWNREAEQTFGWTRDEMIGKSFADTVVAPESQESCRQGLKRLLETGEVTILGRRLEVLARHRNGREFPVDMAISAVRAGDVAIFHAFVHDVSDRRKAELQVEVARELALAITEAETLKDAITHVLGKLGRWGGWRLGEAWVRSPDGSALELLKSWLAIPAEAERYEDHPWATRVTPGRGLPGRAWGVRRTVWLRDIKTDRRFIRTELARNLGLGAAMAVPVMAGEELFAVLVFMRSEVEDEDHLLVSAVTSVAAQLGSPFERKRAEESLRESERRYRLLAANATDVITVTDEAGKIIYISPSCEALTGFRPEELIGLDGDKYIHPDDVPVLWECYRKVFHTRGQLTTPPYRGQRKDGTYRWWESTCRAVANPATGRVVEVQAAARDVTERMEIEEELESASSELERRAAALERSNMQLERFAYDVAHDLGEPLRTMSEVMLSLAQQYGDEFDDEARAMLVTMVDGLDRMQTLVGDLLEYSRYGAEPMERMPVDCQALLSQTVTMLEECIAQHDARITYDSLPTIDAYPTFLGQVFHNLISNALKFGDADTPLIIEVTAVRRPSDSHLAVLGLQPCAWQFCVRDNGIGIDPGQAGRVFDIFTRLNAPDTYPGTGIGLSICKRAVEHHGGKIWVEPVEGGGSAFYFTIPDEPTGGARDASPPQPRRRDRRRRASDRSAEGVS